jgi:hypothetical protein
VGSSDPGACRHRLSPPSLTARRAWPLPGSPTRSCAWHWCRFRRARPARW